MSTNDISPQQGSQGPTRNEPNTHSITGDDDNQREPLWCRFERFHAANPHVYKLLVEQARLWISRTGNSDLGMQMLFERARWVLGIETKGDAYKVNNDFAAFYARLLMLEHADLDGLFELRRSDAADEWIERRRRVREAGALW
jgi:hypothetical protein